eukprot:jgi/Hompol1/4687/HPOL_003810-RA
MLHHTAATSLAIATHPPTWTLLYSTKTSGKSWTTLLNALTSTDSLSTLLIIRDTTNHTFGAITTTQWTQLPTFFGSAQTCLFRTAPDCHVWLPTGLNTNYQFLNDKRVSYPKGLGVGGQIEFFALWLDAGLDQGSCKARPVSTTFGSPPLSQQEDFTIEHIEVYCLQKVEKDDRLVDSNPSGSILNHIESMAILEMAGKKMYSKDVRDPELDGA